MCDNNYQCILTLSNHLITKDNKANTNRWHQFMSKQFQGSTATFVLGGYRLDIMEWLPFGLFIYNPYASFLEWWHHSPASPCLHWFVGYAHTSGDDSTFTENGLSQRQERFFFFISLIFSSFIVRVLKYCYYQYYHTSFPEGHTPETACVKSEKITVMSHQG